MPADRKDPSGELYSIAVVTVDESAFPEMRRALAGNFNTTLASTEEQIKAAVEDPKLQGIFFDLDSIGEGARDGVDVLKEIRAIREDVVRNGEIRGGVIITPLELGLTRTLTSTRAASRAGFPSQSTDCRLRSRASRTKRRTLHLDRGYCRY